MDEQRKKNILNRIHKFAEFENPNDFEGYYKQMILSKSKKFYIISIIIDFQNHKSATNNPVKLKDQEKKDKNLYEYQFYQNGKIEDFFYLPEK